MFPLLLRLVQAASIANYLRGRGIVAKPYTSIFMGLSVGASVWTLGFPLLHTAIVTLIVAAGVFFWSLKGWGKYFSAIHGRDYESEKEIGWIDWIGYELIPALPEGESRHRNRIRGTIQMALRGLFLYPAFIGLGLYHSPAAFGWGLLSALQGPIYFLAGRIHGEEKAVKMAEIYYGAVQGLLFYLSL